MSRTIEGDLLGLPLRKINRRSPFSEQFCCNRIGGFSVRKYSPKPSLLIPGQEKWKNLLGSMSREHLLKLLKRLVRLKARQAESIYRTCEGDRRAGFLIVQGKMSESNRTRRGLNKRFMPLTKHHDLAKSRGGKDVAENVILLNHDKHAAWHKLFGLATVDEIVAVLEGGELRQAA